MKVLKVDIEKLKGALYGKRSRVAEFMDIHPESLSRKLKLDSSFRIEDLNQIAIALNRNASDFIFEEEYQPVQATQGATKQIEAAG